MCDPGRRVSQRGDSKPTGGARVPCTGQCAGVCSELCCAAGGGAQDREEPRLEGVLEHGCGSGRSDSRPLRASGPDTRGWRASGGAAWAGAGARFATCSRSPWPLPQRFLGVGAFSACHNAGCGWVGARSRYQPSPCLWPCVCEWGGPRARHNPVPPHPASSSIRRTTVIIKLLT